MSGAITRGVLFVHSAPSALCPHVEWGRGRRPRFALVAGLDRAASGSWLYRTELSWQAPQGMGSRLTSALRGWAHLRFEVTEEPAPGSTAAAGATLPSWGSSMP